MMSLFRGYIFRTEVHTCNAGAFITLVCSSSGFDILVSIAGRVHERRRSGDSILLCTIFTGNSDYGQNSDEIFGCNKCWILVIFLASITAVIFTFILPKKR
jgi:hypothetical protein